MSQGVGAPGRARTDVGGSSRSAVAARWILFALGMWAVLVLSRYFAQIPRLLDWTGLDWQRDMSSLSFLRGMPGLGWEDLAFWTFPSFQEATARAIRSVGGAAIVLGAADGVGRLVLRSIRLDIDSLAFRVCARIAAGLTALSVFAMVLALAGIFSSPVAWLLTLPPAVYSLACAIVGWRRSGLRALARGGVWRFVALLGIGVGFVVALGPEIEYDAAWYHLGLARVFLESGQLWSSPTEFVSLYPMSWELLYGLGIGVGGNGAAKLIHFAMLPLSAAMVGVLARQVAPRVPVWLPVAIFVTVPTVLWEATTAYVDLGLTFFVCVLTAALICFVRTRSGPWLVLAAVSLGFSLATKHLAVLIAALAVLGMSGALWRQDGTLRAALLPTLGLLSGVAVAAPWYIRSFMATGNPVFPELYGLFGAPSQWWDATSEAGLDAFKSRFGTPRTISNLFRLPWDATIHGAWFGGSLGAVFLILVPASLLRPLTATAKWLGALTVVYVAVWASPLSSFQLRFLLPAVPILSLLAAEGAMAVRRLLVEGGLGRLIRPLTFGLAVLLLIHLPPFTSLHEADRSGWDGWLTHVVHEVPLGVVLGAESEDGYLSRRLPAYEAWQFANESVSDGTLVLNFGDENHLYWRTDWVASHATLARPAVNGTGSSTPTDEFDALGLTHVLVPAAISDSVEPPPLLEAEVLARDFRIVYEDAGIALYARKG